MTNNQTSNHSELVALRPPDDISSRFMEVLVMLQSVSPNQPKVFLDDMILSFGQYAC